MNPLISYGKEKVSYASNQSILSIFNKKAIAVNHMRLIEVLRAARAITRCWDVLEACTAFEATIFLWNRKICPLGIEVD